MTNTKDAHSKFIDKRHLQSLSMVMSLASPNQQIQFWPVLAGLPFRLITFVLTSNFMYEFLFYQHLAAVISSLPLKWQRR